MSHFQFTGRATPKENAEFEDEYVLKVPSEEEVRVIGTRLRNCQYYLTGIDKCRLNVTKQYLNKEAVTFQSCKPLVDSYYTCLSQSQYGNELEQAPVEASHNFNRFLACTFQELSTIDKCQRYAKEGIHDLYNLPNTRIKDTTI